MDLTESGSVSVVLAGFLTVIVPSFDTALSWLQPQWTNTSTQNMIKLPLMTLNGQFYFFLSYYTLFQGMHDWINNLLNTTSVLKVPIQISLFNRDGNTRYLFYWRLG